MHNYSAQTMDAILGRMLARVPDGVDKREGSVIYDALAPAAAELAQLYVELELNDSLSYADTATGEFLTRIVSQFGVSRRKASFAVRKGLFYEENDAAATVPIGSRYSIDRVTYTVVKAFETAGEYELRCEREGEEGNQLYGELLPLQVVEKLARAVLDELLLPGQDEENDESLRARYYAAVNEPAFGGNVAQYKAVVGAIDGIGAVKVYPAWNGGGTVKVVVIASDWSEPTGQLIEHVQGALDPAGSSGQGLGLAPIGHQVTAAGVVGCLVDVETMIVLGSGLSLGMVQAEIEAAISGYLLELRKEWSSQEQLTVRIAQIESRILSVSGVEDVSGTVINGEASNLVLNVDEVPVLGAVTLDE